MLHFFEISNYNWFRYNWVCEWFKLIVSARISARYVYSIFWAERRAVASHSPSPVSTGPAGSIRWLRPQRLRRRPEGPDPRGGSLRISSERDDRRIFWVWNFWFRFFGGEGKCWQVFFFRLFHAFWKYLMARKVGTWGYILVKGFFGVLFKVLAIFFWGGAGCNFSPIRSSLSLKSGGPPLGGRSINILRPQAGEASFEGGRLFEHLRSFLLSIRQW